MYNLAIYNLRLKSHLELIDTVERRLIYEVILIVNRKSSNRKSPYILNLLIQSM